MSQANGQDHPEGQGFSAADDIKAMAAKIADREITLVERVRDSGTPFEQKSHTLMIESVDRITQQWVNELARLRENSKSLEQMVIEQAAKVKDELTRMHLLGVQAMREAERGNEVMQRLAEQIEEMMSQAA